jgi:TrmH family RNA methyltransferase
MVERVGVGFAKKAASLATKKGRDESGLFLVEGDKIVRDMPADWRVAYYLASVSYADATDLAFFEKRAPVHVMEDELFKRASDTLTPQGIAAACEARRASAKGAFFPGCLALMCEGLSDPGNIGTLIRTADAAGCACVVLTEGSADVYNPKIVRATAGSIFRLKVITGVNGMEIAKQMKGEGVRLAAASPRGKRYPYSLDFKSAICVLVGNEARGLSKELEGMADFMVKLPMSGTLESLNAAMAGGILLYEAVRQRLS